MFAAFTNASMGLPNAFNGLYCFILGFRGGGRVERASICRQWPRDAPRVEEWKSGSVLSEPCSEPQTKGRGLLEDQGAPTR